MNPTPPDLASWLIQQVADDEKPANGAGGIEWTVDHGDHDTCIGGTGSCSLDPYEACLCRTGECWHCKIIGPNGGTIIFDEGGHDEDDARLIATWNPKRVLAECAAKRRIVELHTDSEYSDDPTCPACLDEVENDEGHSIVHMKPQPCPTLLALAAIYADRPGYLPEWAPTA